MPYIVLRKAELCASNLNISMQISAQSKQMGQQLNGFPSLMHTDTQFSQLAAQFMRTSILSVYFLTGVFTMIFFGDSCNNYSTREIAICGSISLFERRLRADLLIFFFQQQIHRYNYYNGDNDADNQPGVSSFIDCEVFIALGFSVEE
jgi:hypothetical protein